VKLYQGTAQIGVSVCPACHGDCYTPALPPPVEPPPQEEGLPGDDEVTTIRWGRLRELFDAEAALVRRSATPPAPQDERGRA
jgi:hypothetical protein